MISKTMFMSKDQTWATPQAVYDRLNAIFGFKLDPCAAHETAKCQIYFTKETDGLKQNWAEIGNAYVNPPFGPALRHWMHKCLEEAQKGITVVMLIPARPDTSYWHELAFPHASCICFVKGRIKFGLNGKIGQEGGAVGAPFPSAIVVFGTCSSDQKKSLKEFGAVIEVANGKA